MKVKVSNMKSPRSGNDVPNQFIIEVGNKTYFQSYNTVIAVKEPGKRIILDKNAWDYSVTTSKYRNQFTELTTKETKEMIKSHAILLRNLNK